VQPNRFSIPAYLFLLIPAAFGVSTVLSWLKSSAPRVRFLGVGTAVCCAASFGFSAVEVAREFSSAHVGHYGALPPEVRPVGEKSAWLVDWLRANTSTDGRVLFETSKARVHDQAHMAGYYALTSDREFIGGPYPFMFDAGFWDGFAFGRPIDSWAPSDFARELDLYNIGWIIAHSDVSKRYLDSLSDVEKVAEHEDLALYRASRSLSYFLEGKGRIADRGINRLVLVDLEGADCVLKYHYVAGLVADPPAQIEPVIVPGDKRPFIRIVPNGSHRIALSMR
jgi:hypothetical protein